MSTLKRRERVNSASQPSAGSPTDPNAPRAYQRYPDAVQPTSLQHESPIIPDYDPRNSNAVSGEEAPVRQSSGHRRRDSQKYYASAASVPQSSIPVRTQPTNTNSRVNSQDVTGTYSGRRYASDPLSRPEPESRKRPTVQTAGIETRRGSVPHKSPLQKLEGTLESITKEEKRARVAEAELAAHERIAATRAAAGPTTGAFDDGKRNAHGHRTTRSVSGPEKLPHPPIGDNRTNVASSRATDHETDAAPQRRSSGKQPVRDPEYDQRYPKIDDPYYAQGPAPGPGPGARAPPVPTETRERPKEDHAHRKAAAAGALAAGAATAYAAHRHGNDPRQPGTSDVQRNTSRKLQKNPSSNDRRVSGEGYAAPATGLANSAIQERHNQAPATNLVGYPDPTHAPVASNPGKGLGIHGAPKSDGFRLPHVFHRNHHGKERRYDAGPVVSEWKSVPTVQLFAEDLDLKPLPEPAKGDDSRAWWEKKEAEKRRGVGVRTSTGAYDGTREERTGQTYFSPPLYLKCGPLLRFRGISRESVRSARTANAKARDIWRGSLMIVTIDSKSSYESPPTMRLFKQPVDMLPPPPAEVDAASLSPEYVDPVAGQMKSSRVGKTLYVRPAEALAEGKDLSRVEDDSGLFEETRTAPMPAGSKSGTKQTDGEKVGRVKEVRAARLFAERGVTFWKFNIEIELGSHQARIAYRINRGPATGFWVPGRGETMNMMFHSCNGFSTSVDSNTFSGPDPLWRDVLNTHQTRPFHVMIGGGDQIYNDAVTRQTKLFREWSEMKNPHRKHHAEFTIEMQDELENFYLNRYAMWFSQGLFGMASSQIPMVNIWDDHDIIDGFGSYPDHTMRSPVFTGLGAVAFKYYMLFQHQSVPEETEVEESSWLLGAELGPYINQISRSVYMSMGRNVSLLGVDCRTERSWDSVLCEESWERIFQRCEKDIVKGDTKHLIVVLGIPIAYPRLNFLENILTSRVMDPLKALGRTGMLGGFVNKFDGGIEILDDLDDHWTAKHHKDERNWFIQELQHLAAEKSVRITILGGDVHLCAIGQFYSNKKLGIPKDRDHRYMPNVISSAIVNTPPGDMLADIINKRNKVHKLDDNTDEDMIPIFNNDVDGKPRNNKHLLPRRNWCSIREYHPGTTPPPTPPTPVETPQTDYTEDTHERPGSSGIRRSLSLTKRNLTPRAIARRFSRQDVPPMAFYNSERPTHRRVSSADAIPRPSDRSNSYFPDGHGAQSGRRSFSAADPSTTTGDAAAPFRPNPFVRRPTDLSVKHLKKLDADERRGEIDLSAGLDIRLNVENVRGDPAGTTTEYRLIVPALDFRDALPEIPRPRHKHGIKSLFGSLKPFKSKNRSLGGSSASASGDEHSLDGAAPDRQPSPLGGWVDRAGPAPVSRKPVQREPSRRTNARDSYPPPSSASPPKYTLTPAIAQGRSSAAAPTDPRVADDGRPVRKRYRGDAYEDDLLRSEEEDETPRASGAYMSGAIDRNAYASASDEGVDPHTARRPGGGSGGGNPGGLGYVDPGSPTQRSGGRRRSSWKFWRLD